MEINKQTTINNPENVNNILITNGSLLNLNKIGNIDDLTINIEDGQLYLFNLDMEEKTETNIKVNLLGKKSKAVINIRTYTDLFTNKNFNIEIKHLNKETESKILNYGIANDNSKIKMNIISKIEKGNSGSKAHQTTKVIALNDNATAELNPILLIKEYDVEGSHSATFSRVTEEEIYYLQSRGFSKKEAIRLITISTLSSNTKEEVENLIEERVKYE